MKIFYRILFALFILITTGTTMVSQENVRIKKKEFFQKPDGSKQAWKQIKEGNKNYNLGRAYYRTARGNYLKAYKYNDKNAELNYKIGICYLYADDKFQAIKYLKSAFTIKQTVTDDIHFQLARAYHMNFDFDNAIKEYNLYKSSVSARKLKKKNIDINSYITECETGKNLISNPIRVVVQDAGKFINSESDDYYAVIDSKEEIMYFTSRRPSKLYKKRNPLDKKYSEDIYVSKKKGKDWSQAQLLSKKLTTKKSDAVVALSPDDKKLYVYSSKRNGDISYTSLLNGKWKSPSSFSRVNSKYRETALSFSSDGKKMFFVSDRDIDEALGGKDIYYCELNAKGKWSKPKNMGAPINTPKNEDAVFISKDGKTLYFSSKGLETMGGYDIFTSTLDSNGRWSKPVNIGYPINTPDDDLYFSLMDNGKVGYLSSNREQSIGERDIYKVIYLGEEKDFAVPVALSPDAFEIYDSKSMFKKGAELLSIDSAILIMGKVIDAETKKGIMAKIQFVDSEKSQITATLITDTTGLFKVKLPEKKLYGIEITSKGYLFFLDVINLKAEPYDVVQKEFALQPLEVGAKVVLKNIFFETGKANLKEESFQQLDNVITFMKDNPTLKLEISGHTDNVGSLSSNLKLSEARAKAVVAYMVKSGIETSRLTFKGYGPNQPVALNNTPEGKAQNRRVEFKITGK